MIRSLSSRRSKTSLLALFGFLGAALIAIGCQDNAIVAPNEEPSANEPAAASKSSPGNASAASATVLRAELDPIYSSGVTGKVTVTLNGDRLGVSVNAKGLEANAEHAQHLHESGSCTSSELSPPGTITASSTETSSGGASSQDNITSPGFGSPIISLDDDIANEPGDAANADEGGDSFPVATPGETVNYHESASKSALESALGEKLNLEDRTVVIHAAGSPIGSAAACGELDPVGN